ncbi:restriction endonuclease subunit S [Halomonas sp. DP5N14-9]|uniref:restriction endonuclease subunit S n=1 Tax=Halomonas sp. DP5N14-9 TaxID=2859075 RepID=UPI001C98F1EF|nr:restriction endonuclease subunit S [Halomonas sp. DP5N14-9]MBY5940309.1 restriction endonuclease subunit S [Halomonas sp. DP5N14-9]
MLTFSRSEIFHAFSLVELSRAAVLEKQIPVPPLDEQRRIVDKIESLFAQLDHGEASLRDVQKLLARYRQSVLKAAVTGQLTVDWRAKNAGRLESGSDLLKRILQARRENWQGRGKYKEPVAPDTHDLPELPEGWVWASVEQLSLMVDYGTSSKCSLDPTGVPVLRMGNIVDGSLDLDNLKYLPGSHSDFPKLLLKSGDLLFNRTNSAELVGKTAVYKGVPKDCSYASYLIRVRFIEVAPEYVSAFVNSVFGRQWVRSVVSQQVGQANVNGSKLKSLVVPLPPAAEQKVIIAEMDERLSKMSAVEEWCQTELTRSEALRQSILKDAFSGKLVPQDPDDEPASELLARIRAERDAAPPKKRTRKKVTA